MRTTSMRVARGLVGVLACSSAASCAAPERPITENQEPTVRLAIPAEVRAGDEVTFSAEGTRDVDGSLTALRLEPGDGSPPIELAADATGAVHVFASPGIYTVALVATDDGGLEGRARKPLRVLPGAPPDEPPPDEPPPDEPPPEDPLFDPDADDDGDGLRNADDAAPALFNGLQIEFFAIDAVPRDLLARQKAEDVVESLVDAEPIGSIDVTSGWSSRDESEEQLSAIFDGAPSRAERFALRFAGTLTPPVGAVSLEVELGADDLCVVFVDGEPVASADEEYALDFLRNDRVPALSEPISLFGPVDIEIVMANDGGPYAWEVALRFLDADGATIEGAPTQAAFLLP